MAAPVVVVVRLGAPAVTAATKINDTANLFIGLSDLCLDSARPLHDVIVEPSDAANPTSPHRGRRRPLRSVRRRNIQCSFPPCHGFVWNWYLSWKTATVHCSLPAGDGAAFDGSAFDVFDAFDAFDGVALDAFDSAVSTAQCLTEQRSVDAFDGAAFDDTAPRATAHTCRVERR